jgi:hypothetical protein
MTAQSAQSAVVAHHVDDRSRVHAGVAQTRVSIGFHWKPRPR